MADRVLLGAPYEPAVRLCLWWIVNEADISGQCTLRGVEIEALPLHIALDVVYTLILDEFEPPRAKARERLDLALARPFDDQEALEYDRERWGTGPDAIADAARKDAMFGDVSYEEPA